VEVLAGVKTVGVEVWEAHESIKVTKETVEREKDDDDDDDGKRSFLLLHLPSFHGDFRLIAIADYDCFCLGYEQTRTTKKRSKPP
jgi:hypothetical protein